MKEGFPLLTTKKMHWKSIVAELIWFLRGDTNIRYLVNNDCHIWDGDAYKNFEKWYNEHSGKEDYTGYYVPNKEEFIRLIKTDDEFAAEWGDLGPIYGKQWREWVYHTRENKEDSDVDSLITGMDVFDGYRYLRSFDQIQNLIKDLKKNPDSRRLMVNAWNVADLPVTDYRTDAELYQDYLKDIGKS
jgi:thymidylate synthase